MGGETGRDPIVCTKCGPISRGIVGDCPHVKIELEHWEGQFNHVMSLVKNTRKEHGLCHPRERKACTNCNAREELNRLAQEWKGPRISAS